MSPIDRYLTALGGVIGGRMPLAERSARLREIRGHLEASANEVGMEEATRRFGPVSAVAGDLVRQSRGYTGRSTWALGALTALGIALAYIVPMAWMSYFSFRFGGWPLTLAGLVLPPLALAFFAVRVYQTRRWLVLPALPALALAFAAQFPLCIVHMPEPEKPQREALQDEVAYWQKEMDRVRFWQSGHVPTDMTPYWQRSEWNRLLPLLMLPYRKQYDERLTLQPSRVPDAIAWNRYGDQWGTYVQGQLRQSETAFWNPPTNWFEAVGFDWNGTARQWGEEMVLGALVLASTNALVMLIAKRREQGHAGPEWAR